MNILIAIICLSVRIAKTECFYCSEQGLNYEDCYDVCENQNLDLED